MSPSTRGEQYGVRPTHPEGQVSLDTGLEAEEHWGDDPTASHKSLRLGFININSFPTSLMHHKNGCLRQLVNDNHLNALGLAEVNTYWPSLSTAQQIQERTRGWFDNTVAAAAYNTHNTRISNQQGGNAIISREHLSHRSYKRLYDKLGRWFMTSYRGKNGLALRVVAAYRPQSVRGPFTVYQQQLEYFEEQGNIKEVLDNYDDDLIADIQVWLDNGDQVVIMIDANVQLVDTEEGSFRHKLEDIGLKELIMSKHPHLKAPPTRTPGTKTIDGIFGTPALDVERAGYGPFVGYTDHRLSWIDISWESTFGLFQKIQRPLARRLQCDDPKAVYKYIKLLDKMLAAADIATRVTKLELSVTIPMTTADMEAYEEIDKCITKCMLKAEKKCRQLYMGGVLFSPELVQHINNINFWRIVIRKKKGSNTNMRTIIRLQGRCGIAGRPLELDIEAMLAYYKEVIFTYRAFRVTAASTRTAFQDSRIEELALAGNLDAMAVRKKIKNTEESRSRNRRIQTMLKKNRGTGVTKVTKVNPDTDEIIELTDRKDVEREHLKHLPELFLCADDTPLRSPPLLNEFGYTGDTAAGDQVTAGTYIPPEGTDEYTKLFLKCAQRPAHVPDNTISDRFTTKNYIKRWKSRREKTSSSQSGRHFGHYKVQSKLRKEHQDIFAGMANIPYRTGYSVQRWRKVIDVLIMKDPNNFMVHRTRPIPLVEADMNENSKRMAKDAMVAAEMYDLMANEQYGSRFYRAAIHLATNKRLIYDISRQMKQALAVCSNDAQSCYDRIVHVAAFLALRRLGVPKPMILSMLVTIQMMEHSIRTSFGDSEETYGGEEWRLPPHSNIQGKGDSPLTWAAISTILFLAIKEKNYGGIFRAPITKLLTTLAGFAFVDDTDLLQTMHHSTDTIQDIVRELQGSLDVWQGTLHTTGGALDYKDPNKSYWYSVDYEWNTEGRWKYCAYNDKLQLMMYDDAGARVEVPHCHTNEAHRTLGVMLAPDDNNKGQVARMMSTAQKFGDNVRVGFIRGYDILHALNSTVMRSLIYALPAVTLLEEECTKIMVPILKNVLNKLQIVTTIKRDVLYGPTIYQGMGLKNLYTLMGAIHCSLMVQFYRTDTDLGHLLQHSYECMSMELGLPDCSFLYDYDKYSHCVTHSWMKHLWKFCHDKHITLNRVCMNFKSQRKNDKNLMQAFTSNSIQGYKLAAVNRCRLYLQATFLSDICTGDGLHIDLAAYNGRINVCLTNNYDWPNQGKPGKMDWHEWQRAIDSTFDVSVNSLDLSQSHQLKEWADDIPPASWQWWYCPDDDILYRRHSGNMMFRYMTYHSRSRLQNRVYIKTTITTRELSELQPCMTTPHQTIHECH